MNWDDLLFYTFFMLALIGLIVVLVLVWGFFFESVPKPTYTAENSVDDCWDGYSHEPE